MVGKRGILKILEASIAIVIIFGVILSFSMIRKTQTQEDLSKTINPLLEEIAKTNSLREIIITNSTIAKERLENFLSSRIKNQNVDFAVRICEIGEVCALESYPSDITGNLYAGSRIISSSLISGQDGAISKRIGIFLWMKS